MTKYFYNTETGQADGTAVSTALLPANGVSPTYTPSGSPTVQFKTGAAAEGTLGIRGNFPSAAQIAQLRFPGFSSTDMFWDGAYDCGGSFPSSSCRFVQITNNAFATMVAGLSISTTGMVSILNSAGTAIWTSTVARPSSGYWRYGLRIRQGSTTSNGIVDLWLYPAYSTLMGSEDDYVQLPTANLLTTATPITGLIKGKITSAPTWTAPQWDADQISDNPSVDGVFTGPNGATISADAATAITATLTAAASRATNGDASTAVTVTLAAAATRDTSGGAALAITATPTAAATRATSSGASTATTATLTAAATRNTGGAAATAITATLTADATVTHGASADATLAVTATTTVAATRGTSGGAALAVTAAATAAATRATSGAIGTAITATLTADATVSSAGARDITLTAVPLAERWSTVPLDDRFACAPLTPRWAADPFTDRWATTPLAQRWTTTPEEA